MRGAWRPLTLVKLAIGGFALVAATYFFTFLPFRELPVHGSGFWADVWSRRLLFLAFAVPWAIGLGCGLWAERRFRRGFLDDVWSEAELASVRTFVDSDLWKWMALSLAGLIMAGVVVQFETHWRSGALWYVLLLPTQALQRLRQLMKPPAVSSSGLADWRNFKPIQSEHWGQGKT